MQATNYTNIHDFIRIVKLLEENHGARVITDNDNNTIVARIGAETVAQWFGPQGFILNNWIIEAAKAR